MRRGFPGQILGNVWKAEPFFSSSLGQNELGRAISLDGGVHVASVVSDSTLSVDRTFAGILTSRGMFLQDPTIITEGKVYVETETQVKKGDRVLVSASNGSFRTGEPSLEFPELLNASYIDNSDESNLVTLELFFVDHIYRILDHYLTRR